jgi:hypothetical protein
MVPITTLLLGALAVLIASLALPLTVLLVVATGLRDNGVIDYPLTIWRTRSGRATTVNPAGWGFWQRGALVGGTGLLWLALLKGWAFADQVPRLLVRTTLGTVLIVGLASALFVLKTHRLRTYAAIEILFAVVLSIGTTYRMGDDVAPFDLAALVAAVYVLIRGMDNFKKDRDERAATKRGLAR